MHGDLRAEAGQFVEGIDIGTAFVVIGKEELRIELRRPDRVEPAREQAAAGRRKPGRMGVEFAVVVDGHAVV